MARIYPLFSSSSGNCTYIGNEKAGILIDCGVSCKRVCTALSQLGISPNAVQAVCITHQHSDHICGLPVFSKKYPVKIIAQQANLKWLEDNGKVSPQCDLTPLESMEKISLADYDISCFDTPHDTPASCGYKFHTPDDKIAVTCTDLGQCTPLVKENLRGADMVLLEANYDGSLLNYGPYPAMLKKRISSNHGHLSNNDSASQIKDLIENGTTRICLGHLSQHNNTPTIAEKTVLDSLTDFKRNSDYILNIASPDFNGMAVIF